MAVLVSLISLILLIGGSSGSSMAPAVAIPSPTAMDYWRKLFPETSMPSAILELLTSMPAAGEELKEVSVSYGPKGEEKESKFLPMKNRSNNKNENYFQKGEEELKEVSVSYGGEGEDSQKAFPTGQYKLDKENKKSLYNTKKGLKEESVSYGSEFEEEPRKAFPTGQYVLDKEHENNLNTKKEELKEVTVSYGSKSNLYPTDYGHKKDIHSSTGLKEVSVSYGSDGEKEPRKEIPTGQYMIHSEHGKNLPANKGLKEVSVSYGSEGEDEPRKETPMGQHMLDKEQTKNQRANKQEVREVSVSYGPGYEHKKYIYSTEAGLREVSVSYGSEGEEEPRNAIPTRHYMLDMANRNNVAANKEELREVSVSYGPAHEHKKYIYSTKGPKEVLVSYGSEGEAEPRKVTPTIPYMLDKEHGKNVWTDKDELREVSVSYSPGFEHKKYIYSTEARLKEVSVSYGSGGEERPRKASPTGQYMFDKEQEKNTQANKEELREVFVSYIPGYGHKKYIYSSEGGLKEVSVSYGSDGEEEPKETFSVGQYILDKEHDNSMRTDIGMDHLRHIHALSNKDIADVFFFHDVLRPGSIITPTIPPTTTLPPLLPRHVADAIPFSIDRFADIVAMFAPASLAIAREIRWALDTCSRHTLVPGGDNAGCATSLESLADLAASLLGTRDIEAFSAADLPFDPADTPARRGRYNVTSVRELSATTSTPSSGKAAVVACHDLTYPYAVYYCHTTRPTAAYAVTMVAASEDAGGEASAAASTPARMEALAVCHLDTSRWNPENPFFMEHSVKPGEVSVCHFLTKLSVVWVPRGAQGGPRAN